MAKGGLKQAHLAGDGTYLLGKKFNGKNLLNQKGLKMKNDIGLKVSNVQKRHNGIKCVKFLLPIKFNVFRETNFWAGLKSIGW